MSLQVGCNFYDCQGKMEINTIDLQNCVVYVITYLKQAGVIKGAYPKSARVYMTF